MYFEAGKPTGAHYEDGSREIGNVCPHRHRSHEAAKRCAAKHGDGWIIIVKKAK